MVMESMEIGDERRRTSVLLFEIESNQGFTLLHEINAP